jgi:hypothetical protein
VKLKVYHALDYVLSHGGSQCRENEVKGETHYLSQQIMIKREEDQIEYKLFDLKRPTLK